MKNKAVTVIMPVVRITVILVLIQIVLPAWAQNYKCLVEKISK